MAGLQERCPGSLGTHRNRWSNLHTINSQEGTAGQWMRGQSWGQAVLSLILILLLMSCSVYLSYVMSLSLAFLICKIRRTEPIS